MFVANLKHSAKLIKADIFLRAKFQNGGNIKPSSSCPTFHFVNATPPSRAAWRAACRTTWSKTWIQKRQGHGVYASLLRELQGDDPEAFRQCHRLDVNSFKYVLKIVEPLIRKKETVMRASICPEERLAVTRRFLATGML